MKAHRTPVGIALLLFCGGIIGFVAAQAANRPTAARADEPADKPAIAIQSEKPAQSAAAATRKPQRFGSMIGLRPEKKDEYVRLHAHCWPEVLAMLKKCHFQNYSIYLGEIEGKLYLFSYFEYTGEDIAKDAAIMKADAKTREWWTHTDPCQIRLPDTKEGDWWKGIPEVFHMD
jgi:L-rhamnose mutarotase